MSYREARKLLQEAVRGIRHTPWDVLNASLTIRESRSTVPCPSCKVNKILKYQADRGYNCLKCMTK